MSQNSKSSFDGEISIKSLYNFHEKQLLNGNNNNHNTLQIVQVLGGIDAVLTDYFINMDRLKKNELHQIKKIIQTTNTYQPKPSIKTQINNNPNNIECDDNFYYAFDEKDTFLRAFCGKKHSKTILNALRNKAVQIMVGVTAIIQVIFLGISTQFDDFNIIWVMQLYFLSMQCLLWIPFGIIWLLATNRSAFKLLMNSFEFWFKSMYAAIYGILICFYYYKWCLSHCSQVFIMLGLTNNIVNIFTLILTTMAISAVDGFPATKPWKAILAALVGVYFCFLSIAHQFLSPEEHDYKIYVAMTNATLSLHSLLSSTSRILAIFFMKQAILGIIRNDRAVLIKCTPFIKWSDTEINLSDDDVDNGIAMKGVAKDATIVYSNEQPNEIKQTKVKTLRRGQKENSFSISHKDQEST